MVPAAFAVFVGPHVQREKKANARNALGTIHNPRCPADAQLMLEGAARSVAAPPSACFDVAGSELARDWPSTQFTAFRRRLLRRIQQFGGERKEAEWKRGKSGQAPVQVRGNGMSVGILRLVPSGPTGPHWSPARWYCTVYDRHFCILGSSGPGNKQLLEVRKASFRRTPAPAVSVVCRVLRGIYCLL